MSATVTLTVRDYGESGSREITGRSVGSIIRRVYGRKAFLWGSSIVGPAIYGAHPVLATVLEIDGDCSITLS